MKAFIFLILVAFYLLHPTNIFAHVLETSDSIGAVMHIDPQDDPIANEVSTFYLEFKDKNNNFSLSTCNCTATISRQENEIFSTKLNQEPGENLVANFTYSFPAKDVYKIDIIGKPQNSEFKSFTISFDTRVEREADPAGEGIQEKSNFNYLIIFSVGIFIILGGIIVYTLKRKKMNKLLLIFLLFALSILSPTNSFAHVVVKPAEVGIGSFQTFTVGVPNEKDSSVVALRLQIPEGLEHVSPNVKSGWNIKTRVESSETESDHKDGGKVTEISWTSGVIPTGQRDDFLFSAKVPSVENTLSWKAYQTYADGTVVEWVEEVEGESDNENIGPASTTKIVNDLASHDNSTANNTQSKSNVATIFASLALIISISTLGFVIYKKK